MEQNAQLHLISEMYHDPRYAGKHVVIVGGKIYATKTGEAKSELLKRLLKQHPKERPLITYIPEEEALVLCL